MSDYVANDDVHCMIYKFILLSVDLRGCLTLDVKICTYNIKFGLF